MVLELRPLAIVAEEPVRYKVPKSVFKFVYFFALSLSLFFEKVFGEK